MAYVTSESAKHQAVTMPLSLLFALFAPLAQATPATEVRSAMATTATTATAAAKPDRGSARVCKRWAPIGSLVATHKECHTRSEWTAMAEQARATAQADAARRATGGSLNGE